MAADSPAKSLSAVELSRLIKAARRDMRKDKGLNGDLDRIPILTWLMFLKFLDDTEKLREDEAILGNRKYEPLCRPPYRWRDWATGRNPLTGDALLAFIGQDEATLPDGTRGPGLFTYLRSLQGTSAGDPRDVIATVFAGVTNRMTVGYLLRDVIEKVDRMHFTISEEVHTLSHLYESLLREMRDAASDSGEFYTPRPVVRFMVERTAPQIGETVLDPACGTGGFLVEAYKYASELVQSVEDRETLEQSILGGEPKSLPYLMAQMNLLLHGMESPRIDPYNSLRFKLSEIGERDRVDVILTNPPFGGEEERGILGNFPADKQTSETALLFLQLIMRRLRREGNPGRAALVVPDGLLAGDGVAGRIKRDLLDDFDLHTIVRLPSGVFAPYTGIPTNLLFFRYGGPTEEVWFYELPLPEEYKTYTKTRPLRYEEFEPVQEWWDNRLEGEHAWKVGREEIEANRLRPRHPQSEGAGRGHLGVDVGANRGSPTGQRRAEPIGGSPSLQTMAPELAALGGEARRELILGDVLTTSGVREDVLPDKAYRLLGVSLFGKAPSCARPSSGRRWARKPSRRVRGATSSTPNSSPAWRLRPTWRGSGRLLRFRRIPVLRDRRKRGAWSLPAPLLHAADGLAARSSASLVAPPRAAATASTPHACKRCGLLFPSWMRRSASSPSPPGRTISSPRRRQSSKSWSSCRDSCSRTCTAAISSRDLEAVS